MALGERIAQLRRARGVTQQTLAAHVGVSKAAVSKWEAAQSMPDVTLLPVLAAYFDVTLDSLMEYRAHPSQEELRAAHTHFTHLLSHAPREEALSQLRAFVRRYYADAPALIEAALLLINHVQVGTTQWITEAMEVLGRAQQVGGPRDVRKAALLRAICLMALGRPQEATEELESMREEPMGAEVLLSQAYSMCGRTDEALAQAQWAAYTALPDLLNALGQWATLRPEQAAWALERVNWLSKAFNLGAVQPNALLGAQIMCAQALVAQGQNELALTALEEYVQIARQFGDESLCLQACAPFERIGEHLNALELGRLMPVDVKLARARVIAGVTENSALAPLGDTPRYKALCAQLLHLRGATEKEKEQQC